MKKGFTLIELLAVIVILAIIALIATPIVLSIISDSKESSGLRSAEMYLDAVEQAVSIEKMNNTSFNPNSCDITKEGNLYCEGYEDKIEVEVKGEKPTNGNITFEEGKITNIRLEYKNDKVIIKDENGNLVYEEEPTLTYTSLGNYQHQTSEGVVEAHDTESGTCSKCGETVLAPGLYKTDGTFVSWEQLTSTDYYIVEDCDGNELGPVLNVDSNGKLSSWYSEDYCYNFSDSILSEGKLVIDKNINELDSYCFASLCYLEEIIIPDSIKKIPDHCFDCWCGGSDNKRLTLSNNIINIDSSAFYAVPCDLTINFIGTKEEWNSINYSDDRDGYYPKITVNCTNGDIIIPQ